MINFQPSAIVKFQNFLSTDNIDHLIEEFIKKNINEEEQPFHVDSSRGIVTYYNSINNDFEETKFEEQLSELLLRITNEIKTEIELSNIKLNKKELLKYWNGLLNSFDYIEANNSRVINNFPACLKPALEIKSYLKEKHSFPLENDNYGGSYFTLKPKYSRADLLKIYSFIEDNAFINSDEYSFEDFYSLLNYVSEDIVMQFDCSTEIMVSLLDHLSTLFTDFTRKKIEQSGRFKTKSGTILSVSNYDNTIRRVAKKNSSELNIVHDFFSKNFPQ
ncbi:hypothetical protein FLAN108750_02980 [Flavobacterium antarcticum]|uniref:hypothetical protein n=1 Tax=Flavobacterium antarcticum TaxID=271155 RepID=UPI0003B6D067|nr:hypothetical protein [Flavobacterium antarcticum]